jgi:asparagine synthase (glutamine-hydrolysing)
MLPAGATAWWEHGTLTIIGPRRQPWDVETDVSDEEAAAHARTALLDSVDRHFAGDVRVGVFLSGGADSAAIVALAREAGHDPLAVSLAMPDAADDEGPDAVRTATYFGIPYRVLTVTGGVARRAFGDYLAAVDQPSVDGLNTFVAARFARECGMRVMLSGIGADELFGGYRSFERVPMVARWHRRVGGAAAWAGAMIQQSASPRVRRVGDLLQQAPSVDRAYRMFRGIFTRAEAQRLTSHFTGVDEPAVEWDTPPPGRQVVDEISILELTHYARNQLLRDADVMSMTSGVELRTPFLDADLTSALWRIPAAVRLRPGKRLLASAVSELPPWTIVSPKRCFQFPFDRWLRHEWRDVFAATETASPIPLETWYRKWCVLSLRQAMTNLERAHAG